MNALDAIGGAGGIAAIARELGISEQTAMTGATALLPAVLGGFKKQAQAQPTGIEGLAGMLGGLGGGSLLDAVLAPHATPVSQGNAVLGQIFGSPEVSRAVAGQASAGTGLDTTLLKKMLPMLAMAAAGFMAKQASARTGGGVGGLLTQAAGMMGRRTGGAPAGGLGGLVGMLDLNGDGNPLDDIMGMVSKLGR